VIFGALPDRSRVEARHVLMSFGLCFAAEVAEKRFDLLSLQVNRNDNQCVEIL
jgi:hypothetical protein